MSWPIGGIAFNTAQQLIFFAREHGVLSGNGDQRKHVSPLSIFQATSFVDFVELGRLCTAQHVMPASECASGRSAAEKIVTDRMPPNAMSLRIAHKEEIAQGIHLFELRDPATGRSCRRLPPAPMSRCATPNGFVRKYSHVQRSGRAAIAIPLR